MKILPILLFAFTFNHAVAQTEVKTQQFNLGRLLPTDSVVVKLEYPEFRALTKEEIKTLCKEGYEAKDEVSLHVVRSLSRGETIVDVSFVPVVIRKGKWYEVKNYDLKAYTVGAKISNAQRIAAFAATNALSASRYADHSVLATGKWVKISVDKEGIYQLSDAFLARLGFSDPSKVKLYGYGGRLINEKFTFGGKDGLIDDLNEVPLYRRNGSLLFFAEGLITWTSNTRFQKNTFANASCYFLTESTDDTAPKSFSQLSDPGTATTSISTVQSHALLDNDKFAWYGGGRDFYDNNDLQNGHTFTLSLPGHSEGNCEIVYDVSAQSSTQSTTLTITQQSNSKQVARCTISTTGEGETARGYRSSFTTSVGSEERFTIKSTNTGRLNYLYATYNRPLNGSYIGEAFAPATSGSIELNVQNATEGTRIWQIGDALNDIAELPYTAENSTYKFRASDGTKRFVCVDVNATYSSPTIVGDVANQDLHADAAIDYVIIVPSSGKMTREAEALAEIHTARGLRVKVVNAEQLFNEFSSGTPDASAYRRYMKMLYDKAGNDNDAPRYLLLFGDCSYDNRMLTSNWSSSSPNDYLLAYERNDQENYTNTGYSIGTMHSYVTDDYYGYLDDGEGGSMTTEKIDLGIGRFLCHTQAEAQFLVSQAKSYLNNDNAGAWKNRLWLIADIGDENLHMTDAYMVENQLNATTNSGMTIRHIYPDAYTVTQEAKGSTYPEATKKLKSMMKQGALLFNYNGHGSPDRLSHYFLLSQDDMTSNVSTSRPLWLFASCEITPYDQATTDLGRNTLFNENGGSIAVICASRSVYANYNQSLNRGVAKYAFSKDTNGNRYTLGDALRLTKGELISSQTSTIGTDYTINKLKYVLLGDPAIALTYPDQGITIDSINGEKITASTIQSLKVGEVVKFSGFVNSNTNATTPDETFNGTLTATMFPPKQTITCKGYKNENADNFTYTDYTQTLFEGQVNVTAGRFEVELMIPRGVTFSTNRSRLSLYAVSEDKQKEYNGSFNQFCINGTATSEEADALGPKVYLYLNTPDFADCGTVGPDATLYAAVSDSSGISMVSGNLGHDMQMWMDGNRKSSVTLNDYFTFDYGSYNSGIIEYPLSGMSEGKHTVSVRVWDVFDNPTTSTLTFNVSNNGTPECDITATTISSGEKTRFTTMFKNTSDSPTTVRTEVYNLTGQRIWHTETVLQAGSSYATADWNLTTYSGQKISQGVYLYRSVMGDKQTKTKKYAF